MGRFSEGLFPFSPYWHAGSAPHFGLIPGQQYTLRWPSSPKMNQNLCAGDNDADTLALAAAAGGEERGYIEETSSSAIRAAIEGDTQTIVRQVGDSVNMTGGAKQTQLDALRARIAQDTDTSADSYAEYAASGHGNGRRIVAVPINTGAPDYRIVQIGAFMLLPATSYDSGGNKPFCAEYVGSYVFAANHKGVEESGVYVARLLE
jgi:hypothetical protein